MSEPLGAPVGWLVLHYVKMVPGAFIIGSSGIDEKDVRTIVGSMGVMPTFLYFMRQRGSREIEFDLAEKTLGDGETKTCPACGGSGVKSKRARTSIAPQRGGVSSSIKCSKCLGRGLLFDWDYFRLKIEVGWAKDGKIPLELLGPAQVGSQTWPKDSARKWTINERGFLLLNGLVDPWPV